jgi:hypothetical protein
VPPAVALLNYISSGIFWRIFCQTGIFRGVFPHIINFAVRISEAAMKGVGGIIFHNLGAQWKGTPSYCDLSRFFSILFAARISVAAMGGAEVGRQNMINTRLSRVQRSLEGCDWWGEGRGILYFEALVVQWNDIRPWRPEIGPEGKPFLSGNTRFFFWGGEQRRCDGRGGAQRPAGHGNMPKKTSARSA